MLDFCYSFFFLSLSALSLSLCKISYVILSMCAHASFNTIPYRIVLALRNERWISLSQWFRCIAYSFIFHFNINLHPTEYCCRRYTTLDHFSVCCWTIHFEPRKKTPTKTKKSVAQSLIYKFGFGFVQSGCMQFLGIFVCDRQTLWNYLHNLHFFLGFSPISFALSAFSWV